MDIDAEEFNVIRHSDNTTNQSFVKRIKDAKVQHSSNNANLCIAVCSIFLSTIGCQIIMILFAMIPIAMIFFGFTNLNNCTISPFIPIFLLILGICILANQAIYYWQCRNQPETETNKKTFIGRLFDTFICIWFGLGTVHVYRIYEPNYNEAVGDYCDKTTYLFAFWSTIVIFALSVLIVFAFCSVCLFSTCYAKCVKC